MSPFSNLLPISVKHKPQAQVLRQHQHHSSRYLRLKIKLRRHPQPRIQTHRRRHISNLHTNKHKPNRLRCINPVGTQWRLDQLEYLLSNIPIVWTILQPSSMSGLIVASEIAQPLRQRRWILTRKPDELNSTTTFARMNLNQLQSYRVCQTYQTPWKERLSKMFQDQ